LIDYGLKIGRKIWEASHHSLGAFWTGHAAGRADGKQPSIQKCYLFAEVSLQFANPCDELCKPLEIKQLTNSTEPAGKPEGKNFERKDSVFDSRLAGILDAWDSLPEPIRIGIWALVEASHRDVESRTFGA
jgi:hypothetical protein